MLLFWICISFHCALFCLDNVSLRAWCQHGGCDWGRERDDSDEILNIYQTSFWVKIFGLVFSWLCDLRPVLQLLWTSPINSCCQGKVRSRLWITVCWLVHRKNSRKSISQDNQIFEFLELCNILLTYSLYWLRE